MHRHVSTGKGMNCNFYYVFNYPQTTYGTRHRQHTAQSTDNIRHNPQTTYGTIHRQHTPQDTEGIHN